jgi:hypothetical protein
LGTNFGNSQNFRILVQPSHNDLASHHASAAKE